MLTSVSVSVAWTFCFFCFPVFGGDVSMLELHYIEKPYFEDFGGGYLKVSGRKLT